MNWMIIRISSIIVRLALTNVIAIVCVAPHQRSSMQLYSAPYCPGMDGPGSGVYTAMTRGRKGRLAAVYPSVVRHTVGYGHRRARKAGAPFTPPENRAAVLQALSGARYA